MFKVVKIIDISENGLTEESLFVEDSFFFTIKVPNYYVIYDKNAEIIGTAPLDYNLFFTVKGSSTFEDVDMENILRMFNQGMDFQLVGTKEGSHKVHLIDSKDIAKFVLIEDDPDFSIPFTSNAFDSDGLVIFKNMNALADSIKEYQ